VGRPEASPVILKHPDTGEFVYPLTEYVPGIFVEPARREVPCSLADY
jgi:hypothetical protein